MCRYVHVHYTGVKVCKCSQDCDADLLAIGDVLPCGGFGVAIFIFLQVRIEVFGVGGSRLRRAATGQ